jgi:hypothetical protein
MADVPPAPEVTADETDGEALIRALSARLPEFGPTLDELNEGTGNDPGETTVLMVLAEYVSSQLRTYHHVRRQLAEALAVVEDHLESLGDDELGCELVGYAFFDSLDPDERRLLAPWIGSLGAEQAAQLDGLGPGPD